MSDKVELESCLDFGNSYIINKSEDNNSPRFLIKSKCEIENTKTGERTTFYQGPMMKAETTFAKKRIFVEDRDYDFVPIYYDKGILLFRYFRYRIKKISISKRNTDPKLNNDEHMLDLSFYKKSKEKDYRDLNNWGIPFFSLKEIKTKNLSSFDDFYNAFITGKVIFCKTVFMKDVFRITLEYPVETINCCFNEKILQVDTGPIISPYFEENKVVDNVIKNINLCYISFNNRQDIGIKKNYTNFMFIGITNTKMKKRLSDVNNFKIKVWENKKIIKLIKTDNYFLIPYE